ncbi:SGNH/GDSL hydrolase family protein [Trujillonella endophytica]|uniref:GDSL-like Lipase/Acylhydrolase family protein n=1 Tax=Trujillonella endophytica TaxID=673521 RepID=A0A1H8W514_9ACTN|nr:GDSL-type esterase/lipase family protein [Trujillella endophytica]SEP22732.1 GDSL-like Lipase/Acylhydrolase family protein [Trujillella endophytica]
MRMVTGASALAALVGLLLSCLVGCSEDRPPIEYLALGDSAPFGYRLNAPGGYEDDDDFVGYPALLADDRDLELLDLSCPGETTASFLDVDAPNLCTNYDGSGREGRGYRERAPLHTNYDGAQVEAAVRALENSSEVELVTLQLGANDIVVCGANLECSTREGVAAMAEQARENLDTALTALREDGGYEGTIVVVNYSAYKYEADNPELAVIEALNAAIADAAGAHDAVVADAFEAFRTAAEEDGGDVRRAGLVHPDDTHPTAVGQRLIARTVEALI